MELTAALTEAENEGLPGLPGLPVRSPVRFSAWMCEHESALLTIHRLFQVAIYDAQLDDDELIGRIKDAVHLYCEVMTDYRERFFL